MALPDEAKNFYYKAYIKNENGEELSYIGQVQSLVISPDGVIENEKCFIFGIETAKKFTKEGTNIIDYHLKISHQKEEAKEEDGGSCIVYMFSKPTLESGIVVPVGITVLVGTFVKNNKHTGGKN